MADITVRVQTACDGVVTISFHDNGDGTYSRIDSGSGLGTSTAGQLITTFPLFLKAS